MKLRWKKPIKINRLRGSSSVLVIMIMLLLITFGVLAMMSSYSNLKIARKHAQWTRDYYQLQSKADSNLKSFELLFENAIDETKATINLENNALADQLFLNHLNDAYETASLFDGHYSSNFDDARLDDPEWIPEITFITVDAATNRQLRVKVAIDTQSIDVTDNTFSIIEWREVPKEFEYDETIDFEDPEGN